MKTFDAKKLLPPGWDWENLRYSLRLYHGLSLMSLFAFLTRYANAWNLLYVQRLQSNGITVKELRPGAVIAPFRELMAGMPYLGLWCFAILMAIQVWRHYSYHTQGSHSVYLMRRLPDRWEYHRRCWAIPMLAMVRELVFFAIGTAACGLIYLLATPKGCLPF